MNAFMDKWIDQHSEEIVKALQELVRIPSLKGEAAPGAPFGADVRAALDNALGLAQKLGFETKAYDGYIGAADYGQGDDTLAVRAHLDVVPAGPGWVQEPFGGELIDGRVYGRGTLDNKGPAISALFGLAAVRASGVAMKRKVRVLLGCDEECGMGCLEHYFEVEKMPEIAFTPDAEYPLVHSEKSIVHTTFEHRYASSIRVQAGERSNVVPGVATAWVPLSLNRILPIVEAHMEKSEFSCTMDADDDGASIRMSGLGAHASTPEAGKNALQALLKLLTLLPLPEEDAAALKSLNDAFGMEYYGQTVGLDLADESGRLTLNLGVMNWDETGYSLMLDLRCPTSLESEFIKEKLVAALPNAQCVAYDFNPGHFVPEEGELVSALLKVYTKRTGVLDPKPLRIGGGTYARHIDNAVAFGPEKPGCENLAHMAGEYMSVEDLILNTKMMADAILALAAQ